jgi:hypothetical protein
MSGNGAERVMSYETEKVQPSVGVFGALKAREDRLVFVKLALLDLNVDPDDILPHDTPRTDIQVSVFPPLHPSANGTFGKKARDGQRGRQTRLPSFP